MGYLAMGGIVLIATAFMMFITIRFSFQTAVYYRECGKKTTGRVLNIEEMMAEFKEYSYKKNYTCEAKVMFELEGKEQEASGMITESGLSASLVDASDSLAEFYYDSYSPDKVIFYDPVILAEKGERNNKIAMILLAAGFIMFLAGRLI